MAICFCELRNRQIQSFWLIFVLVRPRSILAVRPLLIVAIVGPLPIIAVIVATSGRIAALLKHSPTPFAEIRSVSPQAGHDAAHIRHVRTAQPPDVGSAGHLLP